MASRCENSIFHGSTEGIVADKVTRSFKLGMDAGQVNAPYIIYLLQILRSKQARLFFTYHVIVQLVEAQSMVEHATGPAITPRPGHHHGSLLYHTSNKRKRQ